jgi:hypothetical protein
VRKKISSFVFRSSSFVFRLQSLILPYSVWSCLQSCGLQSLESFRRLLLVLSRSPVVFGLIVSCLVLSLYLASYVYGPPFVLSFCLVFEPSYRGIALFMFLSHTPRRALTANLIARILTLTLTLTLTLNLALT